MFSYQGNYKEPHLAVDAEGNPTVVTTPLDSTKVKTIIRIYLEDGRIYAVQLNTPGINNHSSFMLKNNKLYYRYNWFYKKCLGTVVGIETIA